MSPALSTLESFLACTEAMARAAAAQEWETLAQLGAERNALAGGLADNLATALPSTEQSRGRQIIEHCQQLDVQTRLLVEERQTSLRILLREPHPVS